jgi:hypothetical protein
VQDLLVSALAPGEPGTRHDRWFALKLGPSTFGIFDAFADETGRQAHLNGAIRQGFDGQGARAAEQAADRSIRSIVLAAKLQLMAPRAAQFFFFRFSRCCKMGEENSGEGLHGTSAVPVRNRWSRAWRRESNCGAVRVISSQRAPALAGQGFLIVGLIIRLSAGLGLILLGRAVSSLSVVHSAARRCSCCSSSASFWLQAGDPVVGCWCARPVVRCCSRGCRCSLKSIELDRRQAPALFTALADMRRRMHGPRFHHVLITDELNPRRCNARCSACRLAAQTT